MILQIIGTGPLKRSRNSRRRLRLNGPPPGLDLAFMSIRHHLPLQAPASMSLRLRMLLSSRFPRSSNTAYHPSPPPPPLPSRPRFRLEHTRRQRGLLSDTRPSSRLTRRIRRITRATCSPLRRCRLLRPRAPRRFSLRPRTSAPRSARSLHLSR